MEVGGRGTVCRCGGRKLGQFGRGVGTCLHLGTEFKGECFFDSVKCVVVCMLAYKDKAAHSALQKKSLVKTLKGKY